ncbi:MAG TPA: histidine triad nucleotide-binding protein [Alphaproteobacteria bacterium]|nr:histidine triad nucleotide-binding protein [Alphaproteobacteria bacterium]
MAYTRRMNMQNNPTIFGKILRGEIPCNKVFENEHVLAFHDIAPNAKVHVVLIPKQHIEWLRHATAADSETLAQLLLAVPQVAKAAGIFESGYRVIINDGPDSHGEVPHLHLHILGGQDLGSKIA